MPKIKLVSFFFFKLCLPVFYTKNTDTMLNSSFIFYLAKIPQTNTQMVNTTNHLRARIFTRAIYLSALWLFSLVLAFSFISDCVHHSKSICFSYSTNWALFSSFYWRLAAVMTSHFMLVRRPLMQQNIRNSCRVIKLISILCCQTKQNCKLYMLAVLLSKNVLAMTNLAKNHARTICKRLN